jgi:hypothetical protein
MPHEHGHHGSPVPKGQPAERRFVSAPTRRANYRALLGGLGAAALGAAAYGQWAADAPLESVPALIVGGFVALVISVMMGDPAGAPIRVGDGGVAVERGGPPDRIPWYEVERVVLEGNKRVAVQGRGKGIDAAIDTHEAAAAWIVKEALARVPRKVDIDPTQVTFLLHAADDGGELLPLERPQVAGRRCKASGVIISFEQDASLCTRCGEAYDKKHAPTECQTCGAPMTF